MDRRAFIKAGTAAGLGVAASRCAGAPAADTGTMTDIGLQLYTVRDQMQQSVSHTLGQVAEIGYTQVEFAGYFDHSPADIRALLDEYALSAPATHVGLDVVRSDPAGLIDRSREVGHDYIIVPFLSAGDRPDADAYRRIADEFNAFGEQCNAAGVRFGYHNHAFEFEAMGSEIPFDILVSSTEPELVTFEMDLFWTRQGGQDPRAYFARYPGRFELCHVKDMDTNGDMVDVGQGAMDFAAIFSRADQAGLRHYFVEHDQPEDSIASIERSFRYLSRLSY